jgi:hypothetical protein
MNKFLKDMDESPKKYKIRSTCKDALVDIRPIISSKKEGVCEKVEKLLNHIYRNLHKCNDDQTPSFLLEIIGLMSTNASLHVLLILYFFGLSSISFKNLFIALKVISELFVYKSTKLL